MKMKSALSLLLAATLVSGCATNVAPVETTIAASPEAKALGVDTWHSSRVGDDVTLVGESADGTATMTMNVSLRTKDITLRMANGDVGTLAVANDGTVTGALPTGAHDLLAFAHQDVVSVEANYDCTSATLTMIGAAAAVAVACDPVTIIVTAVACAGAAILYATAIRDMVQQCPPPGPGPGVGG
jgi:hypothetical protein